jgi:hypothetical protein
MAAIASPGLRLETLWRLDEANAVAGEQIALTQNSKGGLTLRGVLDTARRRDEILDALGPLVKNPAIEIDLAAAPDLPLRPLAKHQREQSVTTEDVDIDENTVPAEAQLRQYFEKQNGLAGEALTAEIRRFSQKMFLSSMEARLSALALKQITTSFTPEELAALDPAARAEWHAMVDKHAQAFWSKSTMLRQDLEPVFGTGLAKESATERRESPGDLRTDANRLFEYASFNEGAIRRSFSISPRDPLRKQTELPVETAEFWNSLRGAESLAADIVNSQ